jgi:hypothetical protein
VNNKLQLHTVTGLQELKGGTVAQLPYEDLQTVNHGGNEEKGLVSQNTTVILGGAFYLG